MLIYKQEVFIEIKTKPYLIKLKWPLLSLVFPLESINKTLNQ